MGEIVVEKGPRPPAAGSVIRPFTEAGLLALMESSAGELVTLDSLAGLPPALSLTCVPTPGRARKARDIPPARSSGGGGSSGGAGGYESGRAATVKLP